MQSSLVRSLVAAIAALILVALAPAAATAADFTMKIGFVTIKDQNQQWAEWYKEAVEKGSKGRIEVQIFPASQLGPAPRMLEGVQLGTIEVVLMPTDFFVGLDPRYGIFAIPSLFRDMEHAAKAIADPELNKLLLSIAEDKGLVGITGFVYSPADYLGKSPIRSIADFKGKSFRINATPAERERMRLLGATAVAMPLPEVLPALQRGQIDGTQSAIAVFVNFKFFDVAKVITQTDDTMLVPVAVVSRTWLAKLPKDLQELVVNEGLKLQGRVQDASFKATEAMRDRWKSGGGEILRFAPDEQARLMKLLQGVGPTVTSSDSALSAFYQKVKAIADKY